MAVSQITFYRALLSQQYQQLQLNLNAVAIWSFAVETFSTAEPIKTHIANNQLISSNYPLNIENVQPDLRYSCDVTRCACLKWANDQIIAISLITLHTSLYRFIASIAFYAVIKMES